ncbi:MAG: molybdate ABC transporter substrate-binding protein [Propionicimonas sp.]
MRRLLACAAALLLLPACSPGPHMVVVFAASSLNGSFTQLGAEFEASHPGVRVMFSFDGSATLVDQLAQGAPADVFAAADRDTMERASSAGTMTPMPARFASNELTLIVPVGNPSGITGLDASLEGTKLVVCADGVPCGSATAKLANHLGVTLHPVSEETKVTDVRAKVETGQADAGIVYRTDAMASPSKLTAIPIAGAGQAANEYLIGLTSHAHAPGPATEFITLVTGSRGQDVLRAAGFGR